MVAKLDTKAEQAAANGLQVDDERADSGDSEDEAPPSADKQKPQGESSPTQGRGPAQKRAKKQPGAVWESACKLSGSAAPPSSQPGKVRTSLFDCKAFHTKDYSRLCLCSCRSHCWNSVKPISV